MRDTHASLLSQCWRVPVVEVGDLTAFDDCGPPRSTVTWRLISVCSLSVHPQGVLSGNCLSLSPNHGAGLIIQDILAG